MQLIRRYSELSDLYFQRLKERLDSEDKKDQDFALTLLNGVFTKMLPQTLDGEFTNKNLNANIECTAEEAASVKQALLASVQDTGGGE